MIQKFKKWLKNNPAMIFMFIFIGLILFDGIIIDFIGWKVTTVLLMVFGIIGVFVCGAIQFCKEKERDRF